MCGLHSHDSHETWRASAGFHLPHAGDRRNGGEPQMDGVVPVRSPGHRAARRGYTVFIRPREERILTLTPVQVFPCGPGAVSVTNSGVRPLTARPRPRSAPSWHLLVPRSASTSFTTLFRGDLLEGPILLPRIHAPNCSLAMLELTAASGRRSAGSALSFDKNAPNTPIASRERSDRSVPSLIMMPLSSTTRLTPCCLAPATTFFAQSEMTVPGSRRTLHHVVDRDRLEAVPVEEHPRAVDDAGAGLVLVLAC